MKEVKVIKANKSKEQEKRLRVAAYCRVSSDAEDNLNSFFAQVKYYTDYIRGNENMQLVDIYADEGITGTAIQKRGEFKRMLKDARAGKIDRILVKSVSRFARNSLECLETVRQLKEKGVSVFFENDNIDTERMNSEMILYIKSAFAQGEAITASKRMQTSARMRMAEGTYVASKVAFGYRLVNKELEIESKEAEIVREIFRLYLSGVGTNAISRQIEAKGRKLSENTIKYILSNERYIGECLMQKFYTPEELPLHDRKNNGELPKYLYTQSHEPMIERDVFETVARLRKKKGEYFYKGKGKEKDFFSGKIRCRKCGWVYKRRLGKDGVRYWLCSKKGKTEEQCHAPRFSEQEIWAAFIKMFNTLKTNGKVVLDETILMLQTLKDKVNRGKNEIAELDKELVSLGEQNNTYNILFTQGIIDDMTYYEQTDPIRRKMYELRTRRKKLIEEDEEEKSLEKLRKTKELIETSGYITEPSEPLFEQIVKSVYVEQDGTLTFCLNCDLELRIKKER